MAADEDPRARQASRARLTRPERAELTRRALLDAAEQRFLDDGYHATSLDAIAADAGYTKGAIFAAFESKAGLFLALCEEVFARRLERVEALFELFPDTEARLAALSAQPIDPRDERWLLVAIEFCAQAARDPSVLPEFASQYRGLHARLAQLAEPHPGALGAQNWATTVLALTNGLAIHRLLDPDGVPTNLMADTLAALAGRPPAG